MCQDTATASVLIPIVSILLKKLSSEVENIVNAAFHSDLEKMLDDCRKRLDVLLANQFLVISSLLDPRYLIQREQILAKQFREYFGDILTLIKSFKEEESSNDELSQTTINSTAVSHKNVLEDAFWGPQQPNTFNSQVIQSRGIENQIEVIL